MKKICELCKEEYLPLANANKRRFCSKKCSSKINRSKQIIIRKKTLTVECFNCNKKFERFLSQINNNGKIFCGHECRIKAVNQKKIHSYLTKNTHLRNKFPKRKKTNPLNCRKRISIKGKYFYEHRLIMETHLGRKLKSNEHIHHINSNPKDNRLENLMIVSPQEHGEIEKKLDKILS